MGKTIEDLKEICEQTNTSFSGIKKLIEYYEKSLHWSKDEAIAYAISLFNNGTIDQIKVLGQDEKRNQSEEAKVNATTIKY